MKFAYFVTASIASGKSTFIAIAKNMGFACLNADEISHKISEDKKHDLAAMFGKNIIKENHLDRRSLGKIVFANKEKLAKLEAFLHPLIRKEIYAKACILEKLGKPYFIELPLFYESGEYEGRVILIYTSFATSLKRMIKRDNLSKEDAKARLLCLMDINKKRALADLVIENEGSLDDFKNSCAAFLRKLDR